MSVNYSLGGIRTPDKVHFCARVLINTKENLYEIPVISQLYASVDSQEVSRPLLKRWRNAMDGHKASGWLSKCDFSLLSVDTEDLLQDETAESYWLEINLDYSHYWNDDAKDKTIMAAFYGLLDAYAAHYDLMFPDVMGLKRYVEGSSPPSTWVMLEDYIRLFPESYEQTIIDCTDTDPLEFSDFLDFNGVGHPLRHKNLRYDASNYKCYGRRLRVWSQKVLGVSIAPKDTRPSPTVSVTPAPSTMVTYSLSMVDGGKHSVSDLSLGTYLYYQDGGVVGTTRTHSPFGVVVGSQNCGEEASLLVQVQGVVNV